MKSQGARKFDAFVATHLGVGGSSSKSTGTFGDILRNNYLKNTKKRKEYTSLRAFVNSTVIPSFETLTDRLNMPESILVVPFAKDTIDLVYEPVEYLKKLKTHDKYTLGHSINVGIYATILGQASGLSETELVSMYHAGLLHDIGKLEIQKRVISKPGKFSQAEKAIMETHSAKGAEIVNDYPINIKDHIYSVHEFKKDGGYPRQNQRFDIDNMMKMYLAQIVSVADVYDALKSRRAYKNPISSQVAAKKVEQEYPIGFSHMYNFLSSIMNNLMRKKQTRFRLNKILNYS